MTEAEKSPDAKTGRSYIYHIAFFIASIIIVVAVSPREGKFRYEYQKGKPWLSSSLIAPWDFPVLKPENVITRERDSILKNFTPFYKLKPYIETDEAREFNKYLTDLLKDFESKNQPLPPMSYISVKRDLNSVLSGIYKTGILEATESPELAGNSHGSIMVITGKIARQKPADSVFSQKEAYLSAGKKLDELKKNHAEISGRQVSDFLSQVAFYNFIKPNLIYDAATSTAVREKMLEEISLSRGMVQKGELIISRGEIVTDSKFMILESLRQEHEKKLGMYDKWLVILGRIIVVSACFLALYLFMYHFRLDVLNSANKTFFIILLILLFLLITSLTVHFRADIIYLIPFAIIPILVRTFYDSRLSLFVYLITIMLAGFIVPNSFEFIFVSYIVGVIAIFSLKNYYRRPRLFMTVLMVFIAYSVVYFGIGIMQEGNLTDMNWRNYFWFAGNGVLLLLSYPLVYVFEKAFSFLSDATLFELADTNQPLLRKLAEEAPGSFQHSLQVANLSDAAARQIGANNLLARTGALYHDIGKTVNPGYFIENQPSGFNPHDQLSPLESASIITGHVAEGIEMARKFNLPAPVIDFIRTHHGTSTAYFFYKKFLDKNPKKNDMEKSFAYPGPKPFSRETAIVMMADAVEASSRSLPNYSEDNISELVDRIVYIQEQDGQFSDTPLTFKDITEIKNVFSKRLLNIYHARIAYPRRDIRKG
jgi:cyclic-di-AMP phosphodiesterase PgpH